MKKLMPGKLVPAQLVSKLLGKRGSQAEPSSLAWLEELPDAQPLESLEKVREKLAALVTPETSDFDDPLLEQLIAIDRRTHGLAKANQNHYIAAAFLAPYIDDRLWEAVYYYHHFLARGYQEYLQQHWGGAGAAQSERQQKLIRAALEHLCFLVKWRLIRHHKPPEGLWLKIHKLYQLAEQAGLTASAGNGGQEASGNLSSTYLGTLMLNTVSFTGMSKKQIDLMHRWLLSWTKGTALAPTLQAQDHLFYVNLEEDQGGRRIREGHTQHSPACRYWNTRHILRILERARTLISQGGEQAGKLCGACSASESLDVLELAGKEWVATDYKRQRRRYQRTPTMKKASVCSGIQAVYDLLKSMHSAASDRLVYVKDETDISFEEKVRKHRIDKTPAMVALAWHAGDTWTVLDESEGGFGYKVGVEQKTADRIKLGRLISLVLREKGSEVMLGIVRNIAVARHDEYHLGIEVIFSNPQPALAVKILGTHQDTEEEIREQELSGVAHTQIAILLPGSTAEHGGRKASLIIPRANYQSNIDYRVMLANGKQFNARLTPLIEQKDDWVQTGITLHKP